MADVQLEHGYTRIANEILEATMKLKLSPTQFKIILTIWRYTYGFGRKDHEMSLTFLSEATGAHKQSIKKDLDKLIEMKIIIVTEESTFSKSRKIAFNKNHDTWNNLQSNEQLTVSQMTDTTVSHLADTTVSQIAYQERKYLKKNIKINTEEDKHVDRILEILEKSEILDSKNITEFLRDDITDIIENFGFEQPEEMIIEAIKESARGNGKTWLYVYKKLTDWKKKKYRNLKDLEKEEGDNDKKYRGRYGRAASQSKQEPIFGNKVGRY